MSLAIPYRDNSRTPLAFGLSALLHGLVAGALAAFFLAHPTPEILSSQFMELVAVPSTSDVVSDAATSTPADSSINVPNLSALANSKPAEPIQQNLPPSNEPPQPTPRPSTSKPVVTRVPGPRANLSPGTVSYADWLKTHPSATTSTRGTPRTIPNVAVDVSGLTKRLDQMGNRAGTASHSGQTSTAANGSSDDYDAKLIKRVNDVFAPPQGNDGLSADISLTIAPDGSIMDKKLIRSSGNDIFDNAVQLALARLSNVDPPPDGKQITRLFTIVPKRP